MYSHAGAVCLSVCGSFVFSLASSDDDVPRYDRRALLLLRLGCRVCRAQCPVVGVIALVYSLVHLEQTMWTQCRHHDDDRLGRHLSNDGMRFQDAPDLAVK